MTLTANPGGQLAPNEVVGRDTFIASMRRTLRRQSIVITAERRMGKTSVIKKMVIEAPEDELAIYRDLEQVGTPIEFVELVYRDVERYLSKRQKVAGRAQHILESLGGLEAGGIKLPAVAAPHWKHLLNATIEDLVEHQDRRIIFFWDEVPLMLHNFSRRNDAAPGIAGEVLDTLRSLRHMAPDARTVFTGSLGLHIVIRDLRKIGYINAPTNDMLSIDLPPLEMPDAESLARSLLEGEGISADNLSGTAHAIAQEVDRVPYFIHHVVDQIAQSGEPASPSLVKNIVERAIVDPHNPWDFRYYRERMKVYYTEDEQALALGILDVLAARDNPMTLSELSGSIPSSYHHEEMLIDVLELLQSDHYITRSGDGGYSFRSTLIRRYWQHRK